MLTFYIAKLAGLHIATLITDSWSFIVKGPLTGEMEKKVEVIEWVERLGRGLSRLFNETIRAEMKWVSDIHMMMELQL